MPANRRLKRKKTEVSASGAFFAVLLQEKKNQIDLLEFDDVIARALTAAYGVIGGAQYECVVHTVKRNDEEIDAVLHVPCAEHRGHVRSALTMCHSYNGEQVRFVVYSDSDTVEGLKPKTQQ